MSKPTPPVKKACKPGSERCAAIALMKLDFLVLFHQGKRTNYKMILNEHFELIHEHLASIFQMTILPTLFNIVPIFSLHSKANNCYFLYNSHLFSFSATNIAFYLYI